MMASQRANGGNDGAADVEEPSSRRRLEDFSEDDFDDDSEDEDLEELKRWLSCVRLGFGIKILRFGSLLMVNEYRSALRVTHLCGTTIVWPMAAAGKQILRTAAAMLPDCIVFDVANLLSCCSQWLDKGTPAAQLTGRALKCRVCNGKLILNALALRQHVASKQHRRKTKGGCGETALQWLRQSMQRLCWGKDETASGCVACLAGVCVPLKP